jgi:hypothetical protein
MCLLKREKVSDMLTKRCLFRLVDQIQDESKQQAQKNAGRNGKIHLEVSPVDNDIARQLSGPGHFGSKVKGESNDN